MIDIYCDGACSGNPGRGGWAYVLIRDGKRYECSGNDGSATGNRMELMAAICGLAETKEWDIIRLHSDSQYLVYTMSKGWKRNSNLDLWDVLEMLVKCRTVEWVWLPEKDGDLNQRRAHELAQKASRG